MGEEPAQEALMCTQMGPKGSDVVRERRVEIFVLKSIISLHDSHSQ